MTAMRTTVQVSSTLLLVFIWCVLDPSMEEYQDSVSVVIGKITAGVLFHLFPESSADVSTTGTFLRSVVLLWSVLYQYFRNDILCGPQGRLWLGNGLRVEGIDKTDSTVTVKRFIVYMCHTYIQQTSIPRKRLELAGILVYKSHNKKVKIYFIYLIK